MVFTWRPKAGALPLDFMKAACLSGMKQFVTNPLPDGRRIAFIEVTVVDGSYHDIDTNAQAVSSAMVIALQDEISKALLADV